VGDSNPEEEPMATRDDKPSSCKKLHLEIDTLRALSDDESSRVVGGAVSTSNYTPMTPNLPDDHPEKI
jgi:hypothetical protein